MTEIMFADFRFCLDTQKPRERRKIPVNVNLKDIFKKKTGLV